MSFTTEELINKAAAILGKYVPGEALGAVEHDTISRCITGVLEEIAKIVVVDPDEIPNLLFETIARLVSIYAAADFSNTTASTAAIQEQEQRIRYLIAQTPTYEILQSTYF